MKKSWILCLGIILVSFIIALYLYPKMPDRMASHWNALGDVDGYMSKFWGLLLMPLLSIGLFLLFIFLPKIDPLKQNIEKFRKYYNGFILILIIFLFYLYLLTVFWNLNFRFDMIQMLLPAIGILFYYTGILTENARRNWFIGVRTPWTLSNDKVWDKTNKLGGKLFKIAGIIALLGVLSKRYALLFVFLPVIIAAVYPIIYSYFEYQKQIKK